jgi:hypothetical protein
MFLRNCWMQCLVDPLISYENVIQYFNYCCIAHCVGYCAVYVQSTRQFCVNLEALLVCLAAHFPNTFSEMKLYSCVLQHISRTHSVKCATLSCTN